MAKTKVHPKLQHPAQDFIAEQLPGWLKNATQAQLGSLRACMTAHLQSQKHMAAALQQLLPLDRFAAQKLELAFKQQLALDIDLFKVNWHEQRRRFSVAPGLLPEDEAYFVTVPALQKLLQNFHEGETFYAQTALTDATAAPGEPERVVSRRIDDIVRLCRSVDVGKSYQEHLKQVLTSAFERQLATDKRQELAVAVEIAAIKGQLTYSDQNMLRQVAQGQPAELPLDFELFMGDLQLLGQRVDGAVAFELVGTPAGLPGLVYNPRKLLGVLLYLPDDMQQPLRRFDDWATANLALVAAMRDERFSQAIARRISLAGQADYLITLGKRLKDPKTDLEPRRIAENGEGFAALAAGHVQRIKADAAFLAVPTAQTDARAAAERLRQLEAAGLVMLNLAGLFVPGVAVLLLADLARQVLSQVYEGVSDWAQGHQHEALEHLLQVASTVGAGAAIAGGAQVVRSAFVEGLEPVVTEAGEQRLWQHDLQPYEERASLPPLMELDNGLLSDGKAHWWRCNGVLYRVRRNGAGTWRLLHREGAGVFGPVLESNGERAWRIVYERPLEWQGTDLLLKRLWPDATKLSTELISQILTVADVDEAHLRGLLVENRPLPARLRDTLERFAVDARIHVFFAQVGAGSNDAEALQWCIDRLGLQGESLTGQVEAIQASSEALRNPMLEHFAKAYLTDDPLLATLKAAFPGLADAYALDLLKNASVEVRQRLTSESRVPLALAEQVRGMLQEARLTRAREALYLRSSYHADVVTLVFSLMRRRGLLPGEMNLVLRERSSGGPVLERLFPETGGAPPPTIMVRTNGGFSLFDDAGRASEIEVEEPQGLFEVLAACLPPAFMQRRGWAGEDAAERIRSAMQRALPRDRQALISLLGWREAKPVGASLHRLRDGRVGYLLSGRGASTEADGRIMRQRIRALYPSFDEAAVDRYLQLLLDQSGSAYAILLRQEQEYRALDESLQHWRNAVSAPERGHRGAVAEVFLRAWRLEGEEAFYRNGQPAGLRISVLGIPARSLPPIPVGTDFGHITDMALVGMQLEALPAAFLRHFPELRRLDLSNNALSAIPDDLHWLTALRHLRLARNQIRMSEGQVNVLAALGRLRTLNLNENRLGSISLRFNQLSRLREIHLHRAGLQAVPSGLEWCGQLEFADLRHNQISSLPQSLIDAPLALRQAIRVEHNPLSVADRERLYAPNPAPADLLAIRDNMQTEAAFILGARNAWLETLAASEQVSRAEQWDALQGEAGSAQFIELLAELTGTSDFRLARHDLSRRAWTMIQLAHEDSRIRTELFERAADPRTCVDSVAHCFSQLEVRMRVLEVTFGGEPLATRDARLLLAQRMFRLDQVELFARNDFQGRFAEGRRVDEVEVSLAYRMGLAERLNLLGQPRTMEFQRVADVTQGHLDRAYQAVLAAETGTERIRYISQRDFWTSYLRARYPEAFAQIAERFDTKMDALDDEKEALGSGAYAQRCEKLRDDREQALDALALKLTQDELNMPLPGSSRA
ncbi:NEL-type E3 ubiquitin ligase domain-containing protein [Pseudomonas alloputida]|uniref:NEL-type E3 ubiquitin ligase domain-containing protein n=1 Tax=Pseudomonas TaxID=286 RepID=UPI003EE9623E